MDAITLGGFLHLRSPTVGTSDGGSIHDGLRARSATMEQGVREELRTHSRYIRDTFIPLVSRDGGDCELNSRDMALLRSTLLKVNAISVTLDVLRFSRIEKALMLISTPGWPADIAAMARKILVRWEDALGPLQELRADLWGIGGRLEGVRKVEFTMPDDAEWETRSTWSVEGIMDPARAHVTGHLGFSVGAWWIKAAAAFRDGIIDDRGQGIIADKDGAYAIVMQDDQEVLTTTEGLTRYFTTGADPGVFKLTNTITSDVRGVVRVLRSWKLRSKIAPVAGLRYDGLYRVISYGVTLSQDFDGNDRWKYSFLLQREPDQPSLTEAFKHPTRDEIDDWEDYQLVKNRPGNNVVQTSIMPNLEELAEARLNRRDSGYFSATQETDGAPEALISPVAELDPILRFFAHANSSHYYQLPNRNPILCGRCPSSGAPKLYIPIEEGEEVYRHEIIAKTHGQD